MNQLHSWVVRTGILLGLVLVCLPGLLQAQTLTVSNSGPVSGESDFPISIPFPPYYGGGVVFTVPQDAYALQSVTFQVRQKINGETSVVQAYAADLTNYTGGPAAAVASANSPSISSTSFVPTSFNFDLKVYANELLALYTLVAAFDGNASSPNALVAFTGNSGPGQFAGFAFASVNSLEAFFIGFDGIIFEAVFNVKLPSAGLDDNQRSILDPINATLVAGGGSPAFDGLITALFNEGSHIGSALDQLSPQKLQLWDRIAFDNFGFAVSQLNNHLASVRGGRGGIDTAGLQVMDPSMLRDLSQIRHSLLAWNPPGKSNSQSDSITPLFSDQYRENEPSSRSSLFVSGQAVLAEAGQDDNLSQADYTSSGITIGGDYRLDRNWTVGGLFSFNHTDATLDSDGSTSRVDSYSPGIYASYANSGWFANALAAYGRNEYASDRKIAFLGSTASGSTEGDQVGANLDGGYEFRHGRLTFGPTAGVQYVHWQADGFEEGGAGIANLTIGDQCSESLRSRLGGRVSYRASWYDGKVTATPHFGASWQHEYLNDSRGITSQFSQIGGSSFTVATSVPQRDSALLDFGLETQWNETFNLFIGYQAQVGREDDFAQSAQGGMKFSF